MGNRNDPWTDCGTTQLNSSERREEQWTEYGSRNSRTRCWCRTYSWRIPKRTGFVDGIWRPNTYPGKLAVFDSHVRFASGSEAGPCHLSQRHSC